MTNWDQLDAMGDLARLNQAKAIAEQQARQHAQVASQHAEVVRLLKEQQDREQAEKARIAAMPKCPDCRSPVEVGSRRCPQCRTDIVVCDYENDQLSWRLCCRREDASKQLAIRCDELIERLRDSKRVYLSHLADIAARSTLAHQACQAVCNVLFRYRPADRDLLFSLVSCPFEGAPFATQQELQRMQAVRIAAADQCSDDVLEQLKTEADGGEVQDRAITGCSTVFVALGLSAFFIGATVWSMDERGDVAFFTVTLAAIGTLLALPGVGFLLARLFGVTKGRAAKRRLGEATKKRNAIDAEMESAAQKLHDKWRAKLTENGLLPFLQSLVARSAEVGVCVSACADSQRTVEAHLRAITWLVDLACREGISGGFCDGDFAHAVRRARLLPAPVIVARGGIEQTRMNCCEQWIALRDSANEARSQAESVLSL